MPADPGGFAGYFETPARAERMQLLRHLLRNADEIVYLRAPAGAGKTLFAHRLLDALGDSYASVWVRAGIDRDVASAAVTQLGLPAGVSLDWPDGIIEGIGERDLLVVVDDADGLELAELERLATMHAHGGRLLLLGQGDLASTGGDWDLQYVDLPPFSVDESTAFLRERAGEAARINDDLAGFLHHAAHGRPGNLLAALAEVLAHGGQRATTRTRRPPAGRAAWWIAGGAVAAIIVVVLAFQESINALFVPGSPPPELAVATPPALPGPDPVASAPIIDSPPAAPAEMAPLPGLEPDSPAVPVPEITLPELAPDAPPAVATSAVQAENVDPLEAVMRDAVAAAREVPDQEADAPAANTSPQADDASPVAEPPVDRQAISAIADQLVQDATPRLEPASLPPADPPSSVAAGPVGGAPVVDAAAAEPSVSPPPRKAANPAVPSVTRSPAVAGGGRPADGGLAWLKSRKPQRYTLQLLGARDRAAIEKFVRDNAIGGPYAIFERSLNGKPWYSLVAGDYADRDAAVAARARLPRSLSRNDVWPRSFASVQESLP